VIFILKINTIVSVSLGLLLFMTIAILARLRRRNVRVTSMLFGRAQRNNICRHFTHPIVVRSFVIRIRQNGANRASKSTRVYSIAVVIVFFANASRSRLAAVETTLWGTAGERKLGHVRLTCDRAGRISEKTDCSKDRHVIHIYI